MKRTARVQIALSLLLVGALGAATASAGLGDLDRTFGRNGKVVRDLGLNDRGIDVVVQPDRRVLVLSAVGTEDREERVVVSRFHKDGRVDRSFGRRGRTAIQLPNNDYPGGIALARNGRIVVSLSDASSNSSSFGVARLRPNGKLDRSFDRDGVQTTAFGDGFDYPLAEDVALAPGGDIVVAGHISGEGQYDFALARFDRTGELDESFSGDGRVTTDSGAREYGFAVAIDSEQRIVLGGNVDESLALARYTANGEQDPSFGDAGLAVIDEAAGASDIARASGDRIVIAGEMSGDFLVGRIGEDGTPDTSFAGDGFRSVDFADGLDEANALVLGKHRILVAGSAETHTRGRDFAIASLRADGRLGRRFGNGGRRAIDMHKAEDYANGIALDHRNIVAAGQTSNGGRKKDTLVVRLDARR